MLVLVVFDRVRSNGQMGVVERSSIELRTEETEVLRNIS